MAGDKGGKWRRAKGPCRVLGACTALAVRSLDRGKATRRTSLSAFVPPPPHPTPPPRSLSWLVSLPFGNPRHFLIAQGNRRQTRRRPYIRLVCECTRRRCQYTLRHTGLWRCTAEVSVARTSSWSVNYTPEASVDHTTHWSVDVNDGMGGRGGGNASIRHTDSTSH